MASPKRKTDIASSPPHEPDQMAMVRSAAVAIDPPPEGAIGIRELLERFERFAVAGESIDSPQGGTAGVRELLHRLGDLAEAGYFSPTKPVGPEKV